MVKTVPDIQKFDRWLQRTWIGNDYTWTESGVMWNGVKRRTNDKFTKTYANNKYIGAINKFKSFDSFVEWVRKQVGYGMKYDLDSDILMPSTGCKIYSEETCLLIPSSLNRFLQRSKGSEIGLKGVCFDNSRQVYLVQCYFENDIGKPNKVSKYFKNLDDAKSFYADTKNKCAELWLERLERGDYEVDLRVIEYMKNWKFCYD
jgi:hypothetical protein